MKYWTQTTLILLGTLTLAFSQDFWRKLAAPPTKFAYTSTKRIFITADDRLFLSTQAGIYTSADGGENWDSLTSALPEPLYVSKDGEIILGKGHGLWRSGDGGSSWDSISLGDSLEPYSVLRSVQGNLFVGLKSSDGFLRGEKGDSNFSVVFGSVGNSFGVWNSLLQDGSGSIYGMQDYATDLYKSIDNGDSWDTLPIPADRGRLKGSYLARDGRVFYVTEGASVLTVDETGSAFTEIARVDTALRTSGAVVCVRRDGAIFVSDWNKIVASYDGGKTWKGEMGGIDTLTRDSRYNIMDMETDSRGFVYAYGPVGLYKSVDSLGSSGIKHPAFLRQQDGSHEILLDDRGRIRFRESGHGVSRILDPQGRVLQAQEIPNKTK